MFSSEVGTGSHSNQVYADCADLSAQKARQNKNPNFDLIIASSGPPEKISASLNRVGLYERFAPHIFSAVQVRHGKPAPDLFLLAAEQMQTTPARCLVIEDSIAGAVAAGMPVLGFHGGSHCRPGHGDSLRAAGATAVFDDMRQLPGLIERIGAAAMVVVTS